MFRFFGFWDLINLGQFGRIMLLYLFPKVITLSGFYCIVFHVSTDISLSDKLLPDRSTEA